MSRKVKTYRLARTVTEDGLFTVTNAALSSFTFTKMADGIDANFKNAEGVIHRKMCWWVNTVEVQQPALLIPAELFEESGEIDVPV